MDRPPARTLLEQLVRQSRRTIEENCAAFGHTAVQAGERASLSTRQLSRWMAGEVDAARPVMQRVAERHWGASFAELLGSPAPDTPQVPLYPELVTGPVAAGAVQRPAWDEIVAQQSADFATRARRTAMDPTVLERTEEELRRISWEYLYSPRPRVHFGELVGVRDQVFRQIESERPRPDQARLLYSYAGLACALLAQSTHELGSRRAAMSHAHAAYVCAELAGHASLQVWIRATQAAIAEYAGLPRETVRYAEAGRELGSRGSAQVRLLSLGANGHARMGDLGAAREALAAAAQARDAVAGDDPLDDVGGVFAVSLAKQHAYAASAMALLRQGPDAAVEAQRALDLYQAAPPDQRQPVNEAYAHLDVAYARLLSGEIDGIGEAIAPVLDLPEHARVDLLDEKLRRLHRQLAEVPGRSGTVRQLQGRIEEFVATYRVAELA